jgi:hypothetical protein
VEARDDGHGGGGGFKRLKRENLDLEKWKV